MKIRYVSGSRLMYAASAFLSCWYFYFSSSFSLRPFPQLFWIAMAALSIAIGLVHKFQLNRIDMAFFFGMFILFMFSMFSTNQVESLRVVGNYVIYYIVARMITDNCDGKTIHSIIFFFSVVHLICLFIQVLLPSVYTSVLLPLLPPSSHTMITEQMNWNAAYYGFSIQSSMSAMYLSIGAVLATLRVKASEKRSLKIVYIVLVALFVIGIFYTQRRGSSAATLVVLMLIYMMAKGNRSSKLLFGISVVILIAIVGIQNIPGLYGILNKFQTFLATGSLMNGRDSNFADALLAISQKPFIGYGGGQVKAAMGYAWLENSFLSLAVQWGIVGATIFFTPYIMLLKQTTRMIKQEVTDNIYIEFSIYIQILFLIISLVENYYGDPLTVFMFFTIVFTANSYWDQLVSQ